MDSVQPVTLDEVESAASIVKRFCTGTLALSHLPVSLSVSVQPVTLDEVESAASIVRRFCTGTLALSPLPISLCLSLCLSDCLSVSVCHWLYVSCYTDV